jgi:anti-sigma factor RsiW
VTAAEFTERDLDRLADYTAGVLDPDDAAEVERLIATDPAWATAHRSLAAATVAVQADLRGYARSRIEPMPADVAARIEDAIGAAPRTHRVVSLADARRRRRVPWGAMGTAAAAVVLVLGGVTLATNRQTNLDSGTGGTQADSPARGAEDSGGGQAPDLSSPLPASAPKPALSAGQPVLSASGQDYRADTLGQGWLASQPASPPQPPRKSFSLDDDALREAAPPDLKRLTAPSALAGCLNAVTAAHPGRVTAVDYAFFEGDPALIVAVAPATGAGSTTAVAVGPDCGITGADEQATRLITP